MLMDYEDYILTVKGNRMKYDLEESWLRRQTYLLLDTMARLGGVKGGYTSYMFNSNWPLSHKMSEEMAEAIKKKRELGRLEAVKLANNSLLKEGLKKLNGRGTKNSRRR